MRNFEDSDIRAHYTSYFVKDAFYAICIDKQSHPETEIPPRFSA